MVKDTASRGPGSCGGDPEPGLLLSLHPTPLRVTAQLRLRERLRLRLPAGTGHSGSLAPRAAGGNQPPATHRGAPAAAQLALLMLNKVAADKSTPRAVQKPHPREKSAGECPGA